MNESQVRQIIKEELEALIKSDSYTIHKRMQFLDKVNMEFSPTTGTRIGTAITQKIGFYNATPIIQRSGSAQAAVGGTADGTYSVGEQDMINDLVTLTNELRAALVAIGIIKGAA